MRCTCTAKHRGALPVRRGAARLAKAQQVLERVLHQQPGHNAHGGRQAGGAHALALERALVDAAGDDQRRHACEARRHARDDHLPAARRGARLVLCRGSLRRALSVHLFYFLCLCTELTMSASKRCPVISGGVHRYATSPDNCIVCSTSSRGTPDADLQRSAGTAALEHAACSSAARLYVARHSILGHARLHPRLPQLQAHLAASGRP